MTLLQAHTAVGSKDMISGEPAILAQYLSYVTNHQAKLQEAIQAVEEAETEALRDRMSVTPGWGDMVDSARVVITDNSVGYIVSDERALELEYGNPMAERAASGLLRSQARRQQDSVGNAMMAYVMGGLNA